MESRYRTCRASRAGEAQAQTKVGAQTSAPNQLRRKIQEQTEAQKKASFCAAFEVKTHGHYK